MSNIGVATLGPLKPHLKKLPQHDPPSDSLPIAINTNAFPIELSTVAAGDISKPPHVAIKALAPTKIGRAVGASLNAAPTPNISTNGQIRSRSRQNQQLSPAAHFYVSIIQCKLHWCRLLLILTLLIIN